VHDLAAVDDDRHAAVIGRGQFGGLGKPPRHGLDREPLMRERHPRAPAERAEPAIGFGAGEVVHRDRHRGSPHFFRPLHYGASGAAAPSRHLARRLLHRT